LSQSKPNSTRTGTAPPPPPPRHALFSPSASTFFYKEHEQFKSASPCPYRSVSATHPAGIFVLPRLRPPPSRDVQPWSDFPRFRSVFLTQMAPPPPVGSSSISTKQNSFFSRLNFLRRRRFRGAACELGECFRSPSSWSIQSTLHRPDGDSCGANVQSGRIKDRGQAAPVDPRPRSTKGHRRMWNQTSSRGNN